ncbi:PadR family transcriptional regulator [Amnibacterium kyonggiense]|uniref:DNA-binding PadR family transcriptional regulator n=1 Tax=Amnibacterium kyonggiense TaxID=595671 RepID=A0A4R7FKP2_9MICO|nr:PadR family transcriptional regulator [Amnibacterium kyonggiense]TDS76918.1 DNA-binding PadR family transcriptional regulator [Amnibacterium kyonggiense]
MRASVFGHGQLRLYLLGLLAERPMHGYELIQELSNRFGGTYAPSAGTVYPRLTRLQEEGLIVARSDGRRTVHEITDAGRALVAERRGDLDALRAEVDESVQRLAGDVRASVDEAMRALRADLAASATAPSRPRRDRDRDDAGARTTARRAAEEADELLTAFRHDLRAQLRTAAARGALPDAVLPLLRARLAETRAAIDALLRD